MRTAGPVALPPGMMAPDYSHRGLARVLPAVATALGVDCGEPASDLGLPQASRVCLVLVDGLGHDNLADRSGHAPFLRSLLSDSEPISSVFPSTTAAALGAFGTGTCPGRTGMVGYTQRVDGKLANMVTWEGAPPARELQREVPLLTAVARSGIAVTSVAPARFQGSGLTEAALTGGRFVAAESLDQRVDATVQALRQPGLAYLYWGDVDVAGHAYGWRSTQWGDAVTQVDGGLARLVRSLPGGTLVVVTADHGMVDVRTAPRWDVAGELELSRGVTLLGGEPRCVQVYCDEPAEVAERWAQRLGAHALVMVRDQAISAGLFGPTVAERVRPSIGDVVVAMTGEATVVDSRTQSSALLALAGMHGSLTEREMRVPLLVTLT